MTAFSAYLLDRKYTRGVSPKTLSWYDDVWRAFGPFLDLDNIRGSLRTGTQQEGDEHTEEKSAHGDNGVDGSVSPGRMRRSRRTMRRTPSIASDRICPGLLFTHVDAPASMLALSHLSDAWR